MEMRRAGRGKAEVEAATGTTVGVYEADFEVQRGEIFVIIGLSGSGKSTPLMSRCLVIDSRLPFRVDLMMNGQSICPSP